MGVSKAILNNVIFCHQEESNWPLNEKTKVKQKFDELFSATKYNKALTELKEQKKKITQKIKETNLKLETVKTRKIQADKFHIDLENLNSQIQTAEIQLNKLTQQIEDEKAIFKKNQDLEKSALEVSKKVEVLKGKREILQKKHQEFLSNLKEEYEETIDELMAIQDNFADEFTKIEAEKKKMQSKIESIDAEKRKFNSELQKIELGIRTIENSIKSHEEDVKTRDNFVFNFLKNIKINQKAPPYQNDEISSFIKLIQNKFNHVSEKLVNIRETYKLENSKFSNQLGEFRAELSNYKTKITTNQQEKFKFEREINTASKEIEKYTKLIEKMNETERKLKEREEILETLQTENKTANFEEVLQNLNQEQKRNQENIAKTSKLISVMTKNAAIYSKIEFTKAEAQKKVKGIEEILNKIEANLQRAEREDDLSFKLPLSSEFKVTRDFFTYLKNTTAATEKERKEIQDKLREKRNLISTLNGKKSTLNENLNDVKRKLSLHDNKLKILGEITKDLPQLIEDENKLVDKAKKSMTMATSAELIYKSFLDKSSESSSCPLCDHHLDTDSLANLLEKLTLTIRSSLLFFSSLSLFYSILFLVLSSLFPSSSFPCPLLPISIPLLASSPAITLSLPSFNDKCRGAF